MAGPVRPWPGEPAFAPTTAQQELPLPCDPSAACIGIGAFAVHLFQGAIMIAVQSSPMDYPPFLKEILTRLVTPRLALSAPPPQKELIENLLSVSDDELTNRKGQQAHCIRSLLLLQAGEFDRSHSIVQAMTGADAAYIHGMIHRVEGDYSNAGYWFRKALADPFYRGMPTDPIQITEAVAKARNLTPDAALVQSLQAEFESLLRSLV